MTHEEPLAATPILDLTAPLPDKPTPLQLNWRQALVVVLALFLGVPASVLLGLQSPTIRRVLDQFADGREGFFDSFGAFGPLVVAMIWGVVALAAVVVHELGHLIAANLLGLRVRAFSIGPVLIRQGLRGIEIAIGRTIMTAGFTGIAVGPLRRLHHRLRVFIAAGPAANLITGAAAGLPFLFSSAFPLLPTALRNSLLMFSFFSALLFLMNLYPMLRTNGMFTDGARIRMLSSRKQFARWLALLAVQKQALAGVPPRSWCSRWIRLAISLEDLSQDALLGHYFAYVSANHRGEAIAATYLEKCLERAGIATPEFREILVLDSVCFQAGARRDVEKARIWMSRSRNVKSVPELLHIRARTAVLFAENRVQDGLRSWEEGLAWIRGLPDSPSRQSMETDWLDWKDAIRQETKPN